MLANSNRNMSMAQMKNLEIIRKQGVEVKDIQMYGHSLLCFSKDNCLRKFCFKIISHKWYDSLVLILIAISTILLTMENPN